MKTLIGISGKMGSGKDTVGSIIQALTGTGFGNNEDFEIFKKTGLMPISTNQSPFVVKKFAGKLKDIICLLLGCTRDDLESAEFKHKELGEEWWKFDETAIKNWLLRDGYSREDIDDDKSIFMDNYKRSPVGIEKLTPRLILQKLGTDCGRDIIHPNIWVNALFADYRPLNPENRASMGNVIDYGDCTWPSWIITDLRFPNELEAIKSRAGGLTIRVNTNRAGELSDHESETALDSAEFDYVIDNSGTIEELNEEVKRILVAEQIITG